MNKDEVWQKIKNDNTKVYGEPIFDVFLKTTEKISVGHLLSLSSRQLQQLSDLALYSSLIESYVNGNEKIGKYRKNYYAFSFFEGNSKNLLNIFNFLIKNKKEMSGMIMTFFLANSNGNFHEVYNKLGNNIKKLDGHDIVLLIRFFIDEKNINQFANENLEKILSSDIIKNLQGESLLYLLLVYQSHPQLEIKHIQKIVESLGGSSNFMKNAFYSPGSLYRFLQNILNFDTTFDDFNENYKNFIFKFIVENAVKNKMIENQDVILIFHQAFQHLDGRPKLLDKIATLLGDSIDELDEFGVYEILSSCRNQRILFKVANILKKYNINKLSPQKIQELFNWYVRLNKGMMTIALSDILNKYYKNIDDIKSIELYTPESPE